MAIIGGQLIAADVNDFTLVQNPAPCGTEWQFSADRLLEGRVVLRFMPGADTGTCTNKDLPALIEDAAYFKDRGIATYLITRDSIDTLIRWIEAAGGDVETLIPVSDRELELTYYLDVAENLGRLGHVPTRAAIVLENGTIKAVKIEDHPKHCDVTAGHALRETVDAAFPDNGPATTEEVKPSSDA